MPEYPIVFLLRIFTAPFTSAFIVASHDEQTYRPRSTRFESRICPEHYRASFY